MEYMYLRYVVKGGKGIVQREIRKTPKGYVAHSEDNL